VLAFLTASLLLGIVYFSDTAKCSCISPDLGFLADPVIEIPNNAQGILWAGVLLSSGGLIEFPPIGNFHIDIEQDGRWHEVPVQLKLIRSPLCSGWSIYDVLLVCPGESMNPGDNLRFIYQASESKRPVLHGSLAPCDSQVVYVTVSSDEFMGYSATTTASNAKHGMLSLAVSGGWDSQDTEAYWVDIASILPDQYRRWADSLYYTTVVSGQYYWHPREGFCDPLPPGRSWSGMGEERLYCIIKPSGARYVEPGLDRETSSAMICAWLPGTAERIYATVRFSFEVD
jgi:hypothetical protein